MLDWVLYGKIDGKIVVKPERQEFFGLDRKEAVALGLVKEAEPGAEKKKRGRPRKNATPEVEAEVAA